MKQCLIIFFLICFLAQQQVVATQCAVRAINRVNQFMTILSKPELVKLRYLVGKDAFVARRKQSSHDAGIAMIITIVSGIISGIQIVENREKFQLQGLKGISPRTKALLVLTVSGTCLAWHHMREKDKNTMEFGEVLRGD